MSKPVPEIRSFEEFWPYYVRAHANKTNRSLHFAGTTAGAALVAAGILTLRPSLVIAGPIVGYGCAWIGHFFIEGNVPASFGHPWWSFKGDWVMWRKILDGTMDDEVERVLRASEADVAPKSSNGRPADQPS